MFGNTTAEILEFESTRFKSVVAQLLCLSNPKFENKNLHIGYDFCSFKIFIQL